ncbi:MAG: hypothetical protein ACREV2_17375, partial [Burkholderiales bacterium]
AAAGNGGVGTNGQVLAGTLIDPVLGSAAVGAAKSGYVFTVTPDNTAAPPNFFAFCVPSNTGALTRTGHRSFTIADDGILRGKVADAGPADYAEATAVASWPALGN